MRVEGPSFGLAFAERQTEDLRSLVDEMATSTGRLCPECDLACSCSASPICTCDCSPGCDHASMKMTSDPEFPIESLIAPLVFAFLELRQCPPCWSCQGHLDLDGSLKRPPTVWFYARSQVFPGMIGDYAVSLWAKKKINTPWRVSIAGTDAELSAPAYSFQPDIAKIEKPHLPELQRDIAVIANGLKAAVDERAKKLVSNIDRYQEAHASRIRKTG